MQNYMIEEPSTQPHVDQTLIVQDNIQKPLSSQQPTVPHIAIQNSSMILGDQDVLPVVAALQIQLDRDWQPAWNSSAKLVFYSKNQTIPENIWHISILDNSDVEGALGYHDESNLSVPYGKIFVQDAIMHGFNWSVSLSHELLEMISNPWINLTVFAQMH